MRIVYFSPLKIIHELETWYICQECVSGISRVCHTACICNKVK